MNLRNYLDSTSVCTPPSPSPCWELRARSALPRQSQKNRPRPPDGFRAASLYCFVSPLWAKLFPSLHRRELPAGVVDGILPLQNELGDGHHHVPLLYHPLQYPRQGLRGVEGGVVEQHDAPRPHLGRDPPKNGVSVVVLPVQAVPIPHTGKRPWEAALGRFATHLSPKIRPGEKPVPA